MEPRAQGPSLFIPDLLLTSSGRDRVYFCKNFLSIFFIPSAEMVLKIFILYIKELNKKYLGGKRFGSKILKRAVKRLKDLLSPRISETREEGIINMYMYIHMCVYVYVHVYTYSTYFF